MKGLTLFVSKPSNTLIGSDIIKFTSGNTVCMEIIRSVAQFFIQPILLVTVSFYTHSLNIGSGKYKFSVIRIKKQDISTIFNTLKSALNILK